MTSETSDLHEEALELLKQSSRETLPLKASVPPTEMPAGADKSQQEAAPKSEAESSPEPTSATEWDENPALSLSFSPLPDEAFKTSVTLDIFCVSEAAQIRYALGSKDVGEDGLLFDAKDKILLTQTTLIAARAFEKGQKGPLLTGRFEIHKPEWQELEPAEQSDPTPHKISEVLSCPDGWQVAAGSVRGKLHAHRALWREDSFALDNIETSGGVWSVAIVSDGAGSASLSRVGSRVACAAVLKSLRATLQPLADLAADKETLAAKDLPLLHAALIQSGADALEAIRLEGQARGKPLTTFAATLLVLVRRVWNDGQICAALQVGDGALALWDGSALTLLGEADHGQHSSETRFLTTNGIEAELASRIKFSIKKDLTAFAVMSDGISDDFFPEGKRLGEVFKAVLPLVKQGDAGVALVEWLGYEKKGSSDDRTLIIGWLNETQTEAPNGEKTTAPDGHSG